MPIQCELKKAEQAETAEIMSAVAKLHKCYFGKGPKNISAAINQNFITVKAEGILSKLEINLLDVPDGAKRVRDIRKDILSKKEEELLKELSLSIGIDLDAVMYEFFLKADALVMVFIRRSQKIKVK